MRFLKHIFNDWYPIDLSHSAFSASQPPEASARSQRRDGEFDRRQLNSWSAMSDLSTRQILWNIDGWCRVHSYIYTCCHIYLRGLPSLATWIVQLEKGQIFGEQRLYGGYWSKHFRFQVIRRFLMVSTLCLAVEVKQKKDCRLFARNMETNGTVDVWADASLSRFRDRFADFGTNGESAYVCWSSRAFWIWKTSLSRFLSRQMA